jgi:hypothetical protein
MTLRHIKRLTFRGLAEDAPPNPHGDFFVACQQERPLSLKNRLLMETPGKYPTKKRIARTKLISPRLSLHESAGTNPKGAA